MAITYRTFYKKITMQFGEALQQQDLAVVENARLVYVRLAPFTLATITPNEFHQGVALCVVDRAIADQPQMYGAGDPGYVANLLLPPAAAFISTDILNTYAPFADRAWTVLKAPIWPLNPSVIIERSAAEPYDSYGFEYVLREETISELERTQQAYGKVSS